MQQLFMFLDYGSGWTPVNDHETDLAALDSLSIQWGTDEPDEQPDPSVCTFTLRDRTGHMAGMAATLAGCRVIVQMSEQPKWDDMPAGKTWADYPGVMLCYLFNAYEPPDPDTVDSPAVTVFDGIVTTGGEARHVTDDQWDLRLSATSRMVLWKRSQKQGPTSTEARYAGYHWVGNPAARLAELRARAAGAGLPPLDTGGLELPPAVSPYTTDEYPSMLDLLHRMYATSPLMPIWGEIPDRAASRIGCTPLGKAEDMNLDAAGRLYVDRNRGARTALLGDVTIGDDTYTVPEPYTQITYKTKSLSVDDDGTLQISDAETVIGDQGVLPAQLTATQNAVSMETDVPSANTTGGASWTPSDADRAAVAQWLYTNDTRLRPQGVTFDSRRIDPTDRPYLFISAPSGPIVFAGALGNKLSGADGRPAFTGAWTTIGGTLTFKWIAGKPVLRHEVSVWPLPVTTAQHVWNDIADWQGIYSNVPITWDEMELITLFDTEEV